jgi:hypothetical protein
MLWVIASLVVYTCIIVLGAYLFSAPRYHGPVSDHFDGKVFANIGGAKAKGWKDLQNGSGQGIDKRGNLIQQLPTAHYRSNLILAFVSPLSTTPLFSFRLMG